MQLKIVLNAVVTYSKDSYQKNRGGRGERCPGQVPEMETRGSAASEHHAALWRRTGRAHTHGKPSKQHVALHRPQWLVALTRTCCLVYSEGILLLYLKTSESTGLPSTFRMKMLDNDLTICASNSMCRSSLRVSQRHPGSIFVSILINFLDPFLYRASCWRLGACNQLAHAPSAHGAVKLSASCLCFEHRIAGQCCPGVDASLLLSQG